MNRGENLERFVEHMFRDLGKSQVRRNLQKRKGEYRAQIDVQYGLISKTFIECKDYSQQVQYHHFMKFVGVCQRFQARGVMVTTSDFDRRCYQDADNYNIQLINGKKLKELHRKTSFLEIKKPIRHLVRATPKQYRPSLRRRINSLKPIIIPIIASIAYYNLQEHVPQEYTQYLKMGLEFLAELVS